MDDETRLRAAYIELLRLPMNDTRAKVQPALASLRDEIARLSGADPQDVQDSCERHVRGRH